MLRSIGRWLRVADRATARAVHFVGIAALAVLLGSIAYVAAYAPGWLGAHPLIWLAIGVAVAAVLTALRRTLARERDKLLAQPVRRVRQLALPDGFYKLGVEREAPEVLREIEQEGPLARYLPRDVDAPLRARIVEARRRREPTLIALSGPARTGKTRTVAEALAELLGRAWLIVPKDGPAVAALARQSAPVPFLARRAPCVIWLDDLEEYVSGREAGLDETTLDAFRRWHRPVLVLATVGGKGVRSTRDEPQRHDAVQAELVRNHQPLLILERPSETELEMLRSSEDGRRVAERLGASGVPEFMLAATRKSLLLDLPSERPALGVEPVARALRDIVVHSEPRFAIGIFGGWGSGKTTLMRAIESRLRERNVVCVDFVAWRYEKEEHLIVPLLDAIREALVEWAGSNDQDRAARHTAATVGRVIRSILAGVSLQAGLPGAMKLSFDANRSLGEYGLMRTAERERRVPKSFYHASFLALKAAFEEFLAAGTGRRIAVFVDDLDRCLPENALQILESMKLFFDLDGFVFIVGLDEAVIEFAVEKRYGSERANGDGADDTTRRISGKEYIKKIFQLPYRLAPVSMSQLAEFVKAASDDADLNDDQKAELRSVVEPHLRFLAQEGAINPREVKRYINLYTLQSQVDDDLDPDVILTLQTLAFRREWQKTVWYDLLEFRELYVDAVRRQLIASKNRVHDELPGEFDVPDEFLKYVTDGAPGHVLLQTTDLGRYLAAGEAVRSTQNAELLDALAAFGQVRRGIEAARLGEITAGLAGALASRLALVERQVAATAGTSEPTVAAVRSLQGEVARVMERLPADDPPPADELERMIAPVARHAESLSLRLRRLYREGDLAAPPPADVAEPDAAPAPAPAGGRRPADRPEGELQATRLRDLSEDDFGITAPRPGPAPYVPRDVDNALRSALGAALEQGGPTMIVVTGPAKAGKSRTLYEAVKTHPRFRDAVVVIPADLDAALDGLRRPESLRRMPPGPVVLWLDDLERFGTAGTRGLRPAVVTELARLPRKVVALATARSERPGGDETRALAQHTLVRVIPMELELHSHELEAFRARYPDEPVAEPSIAATLAGAPIVAAWLATAESTEGEAVVRAAASWTLAGMARPVPEDVLHALWSVCLTDGAATDERFRAGLEWALDPVPGTGIPLLSRSDDGYLVSDWVVAVGEEREIDPRAWDLILEQAPPEEALMLGIRAAARHDVDAAAAAFLRAEHASQPQVAAAAMVENGRLLLRSGDEKGAETAFRRAEAGGDLDASVELGKLLLRREDIVAAEEAFHRADDAGNPAAATQLGYVLMLQNDAEGAVAAFRRAEERGDRDGLLGLAEALTRTNDARGAEDAFRRADELGSDEAAVQLGLLLERRGDVEGAVAAFERADQRGSGVGAHHLGDLLVNLGDLDRAEPAYRRAIERGRSEAGFGLGQLLQTRGDIVDK